MQLHAYVTGSLPLGQDACSPLLGHEAWTRLQRIKQMAVTQDNTHTHSLPILFLASLRGMWDLSSWPGIEPRLPAVETQSHNHWTTREVPILDTEYGLITLKWLSKCYLGSTDSLIWSWEHESLASVFLSSEIQYILGEHHWLFFPFHKEKIFE